MISKQTMRQIMKPMLMLLVMVLASKLGFSQDPGDNPDGPPPAVPFEDYMHLYLLAAGAILALITIRRVQRKQVQ
jgi:hypothetical protein